MRTTMKTKATMKAVRRMAVAGRHETMLRRAANHNVHVMTPHGKIFAGRKGRKG